MALFICAAKLDPEPHGTKRVKTKAIHHAVGISRRRNSGYRLSSLNIMAHGLSTSFSRSLRQPLYAPLSKKGVAQQLHYTHH